MHKITAIFFANADRCPPVINGIRLLAQYGFQVDLFCRDTNEPPTIVYPDGTKVIRIDGEDKSLWQQYIHFSQQIAQLCDKSTSLFIAHDMYGLVPSRFLATYFRRPLIYQNHELIDRSSKLGSGANIVYTFQQLFARTANLVIVPDTDRARVVKTNLRLKTQPLVVTNSPIRAPYSSDDFLRTHLGERSMSFDKIVFRQGSHGPSHAIETTIRSMPMWQNSKWGFVILGPIQQDYLLDLIELATKTGVNKRFVALPAVSYDEVLHFTAGAHLGHAMYSPINSNNRFSGTASNKLMEYMSVGIPVLVSDRPNLRAFVEKYKCGLPVDENSPNSIASAVNTILGTPTLAKQMGAAGQYAFNNEFSYERQFMPVIDALHTLINNRNITQPIHTSSMSAKD